ncbi:MAG: hemin uptake protein HemP [Myxococcota bacterium]
MQPIEANPAAAAPKAPDQAVRTVNATDILGPAGLLRIELDGELYTLRLTRNHRLILTK